MRTLKDEEIVRRVMADTAATPREKEMAYRIHRLVQAFDQVDTVMVADIERGEVWHGTVH